MKNANKIPDGIKQFNALFLVKADGKNKIRDRQAIKEYKIEKSVDTQGKEADEYAAEIMNTYLRKSLRKHSALLIEVFACFCDQELFCKKMQEPEIDEKLDRLIEILNEDFNREKQKEEWAKSIENQAVRVRVEKESNWLALASYFPKNDQKDKKNKKEDIFKFLIAFAEKSEKSPLIALYKILLGKRKHMRRG